MSPRNWPPSSLTDTLDALCSERSDAVAYVLLGEGNVEVDTLTFGELRRRALAVGAALAARGAAGERALLTYPQCLEFVVAFVGCLYAGVIPVPTTVPNRKRGLDIVRAIAEDCSARFHFSTGATLAQLREEQAEKPALGALTLIDPEEDLTPQREWQPPPSDESAIALLQYTSGSTRAPRGAVVSNGNLAANHHQVSECLAADESSVYVSWLPMFHDMGLGIALQAIWVGVRCVLLSPRAFMQEPRRWLQAISHYRATTSGGPDSAFALCIQRISPEERRELDLSSWRVAFDGSEPVQVATLEHFAETFAECGFRREALHPVYGLAEVTLLAASEPPRQGPLVRHFSLAALEEGRAQREAQPDSGRVRTLASCGRPWPGTELVVVESGTTTECEPGRTGEIWLRGASVARGYFQRDAETQATFGLTTADGRSGFVRSGDLGLMENGALFVLGRQRDLLEVRGRRLFPHDLEATASTSHPALVAHGCAAILAPFEGVERLVLIQEVARTALRTLDKAETVNAIRQAIAEHHQLKVHAVVLIKPATLPRTTSGKVRRAYCREALADGSLATVDVRVELPSEPKIKVLPHSAL